MINGDASDDYDNDYDTIGSNSDSDIDMPLPQPQDLQEITEKAIKDLSGHIPVDDPATARNDVFVLEIPTEDFLPDDLRMPPPPVPATAEHASILSEDDSELVQHNRSSQPFSPYLAFMAMWAEKYNLSRQAYQDLNEGLPLGQDLNIKAVELPRDVTTLKKQFMAQLPLLPLWHKMVDLNQEKLPTMTPAEKTGPRKDRQADAHWFDVATLVTAILSAEDLHKDFWKGLGAFDEKEDGAKGAKDKEKAKEKPKIDPVTGKEFVECMRRIQYNLAYLAAIADRSHKPSSQIPPHPAVISAPSLTPLPKPAAIPQCSNQVYDVG
ncbi:hypothetical protein VC83_02237 [Pseudogymnoascus destructans]|uniref:Uncharacterized protein n=1 Tax=Pseudogymnoascus destructans TaxID=655981 RepID=A0A177AJ95_9PEZI|nr:uncharacterized protein VC83_02237 [Pseudogymnoascus destructans]OAF61572.1 hypothetical protein VC83_02237 [Pseudogymnoascus destructans]